ncbi:nitroreductase/quinone reductase family protein [Streptomyces sp. NPDC051954]|uniref:nitroreductase/quinone reductase family protein n=1 Tax=unclassified Streptomyces TaxID=2593676 RepID=UPI003432FA46
MQSRVPLPAGRRPGPAFACVATGCSSAGKSLRYGNLRDVDCAGTCLLHKGLVLAATRCGREVPEDRGLAAQWDWVAEQTRTYLASGGTEGHESNGVYTLVLATTGRRNGIPRRTCVIYGTAGEDFVVASEGGADEKRILRANPHRVPPSQSCTASLSVSVSVNSGGAWRSWARNRTACSTPRSRGGRPGRSRRASRSRSRCRVRRRA